MITIQKKRKTVFSVLSGMLILSIIAMLTMQIFLAKLTKAETLSLVYKLDFSDSSDYGKNTADTGTNSAMVYNNGNMSIIENAIKGKNALKLISDGNRKNYLALPSDVLNYQTVTLAGWFKINGDISGWARMWEINNNGEGNANSHMSVMPCAPNYYNGLHINTVIAGNTVQGYGNADNMLFEGVDSSAETNMPQSSYILPACDTWVHYAYEFTADSFSIYQNGKLLINFIKDNINFNLSQFYSENAALFLGATNMDGTADFSGSFADIRIYSNALTSSQIISEYNLSYNDFLTTSYDFENGTADSIRNYNGVAVGNASIVTLDNNGVQNKVLYLDGSNSGTENNTKTSMEIPFKTLNGHNELTVSFDVFIDSSCGNYTRLIEFAPRGSEALMLGAKWGGTGNLYLKYTNNNDAGQNGIYFSPVYDKWINITFTLDGSEGFVYVNGMPVASGEIMYKNSLFWENMGCFALGRTQYWNDEAFKGYFDNIKIYQTVLTEKDVMTEEGVITIQDDAQAVASEKEKLNVDWNGSAGNIDMPSYADEGVHISWQSSNTDIITTDGEVLFPDEPAEVTLTATLTRGSAVETKKFILTINSQNINVNILNGTNLSAVTFEEGTFYEEMMETNLDLMFSLDKDRLLYNYRKTAGLNTLGATSYGAWISETSNGAGQFEAHYITALAKASQTMPNYSYNGETILQRLTYMVNALKQCQDAYALLDLDNAGYLAAITVENFDALEEGRNTLSNGTSVWVPWYFMHKNLEGLYDTCMYSSDSAVANTAKGMMDKLADWCYERMNALDVNTLKKVLEREYGGMAEVLYQIYGVTKNANHFKAAKFFEEKSLLDNIYNNVDVLTGLHANTAIPKFLGCAAVYEITGNDYYKSICVNFYEMVMKRTYATGGTGVDEFFGNSDICLESNGAQETCCSYNMLKLADYLFRWTGDVKYADYFEKTYINHILASMDPDSGQKTYFVNTTFGYYKIYSSLNSFWCCTCTGMESFAKLPYGIYYKTDDMIKVNMFFPSEFKYSDSITLKQSGNLINDSKTIFTVEGSGNFTLSLRVPSWTTGAEIYINGEKQTLTSENGYFNILRNWNDGDNIEYRLPMEYRLEILKGSDNHYALMYGPILLVADLGTDDIQDIQSIQLSFGNAYTGDIENIILADTDNINNGLITKNVDSEGNFTFEFTTQNQDIIVFKPFNQLFHSRYGMYFAYYSDISELDSKYKIDGNEAGNEFENTEDLSNYGSYSSGSTKFTVEDGKLLAPSSTECKLLANLSLTQPYTVDVTISPYTKSGVINGGLYLFAQNAANSQDNIKAYNIQIERAAGSNSYKIYVFKFNGEYLGSVTIVTLVMPENEIIALHVFVGDDMCYIYTDGKKNAVLSFAIDKTFITEDSGDVGLRSQQCKMFFDKFTVTSVSLPVGRNILQNAVNEGDSVNQHLYTGASAQQFLSMLSAAKTVLNDVSSTQYAVNEANENLREALSSLILKGNNELLIINSEYARTIDGRDFTDESYVVLVNMLDSISKLDFDVLQQSEIDNYISQLSKTVFGLVRKPCDLTKLNELILHAEALKETDYTSESWTKLSAALSEAKKINSKALASEADETRINLLTAENNLVSVVEEKTDNKVLLTVAISYAVASTIGLIVLILLFIKKKSLKIN